MCCNKKQSEKNLSARRGSLVFVVSPVGARATHHFRLGEKSTTLNGQSAILTIRIQGIDQC